jgi:hypothetical protein
MSALKEVSTKYDALKKECRGTVVLLYPFLSLLFSRFLTCILHLTRTSKGEEAS